MKRVALWGRSSGLHFIPFCAVIALLQPSVAGAHCDTTKGPVITDARSAIEQGDPNLVLHWVGSDDEDAVREAFEETMAVRALSPEAATFAERYFFETLVRIHRAGEGAPYTGLTDDDPEPIIVATDQALETGSPDALEQELVGAVRVGLARRFRDAHEARRFPLGDVDAGRAFVAKYVSLTHWVEGVHNAVAGAAGHHPTATPHVGLSAHAVHTADGHDQTEHNVAGAIHHLGLAWGLALVFAIVAALEGLLLVRAKRESSSTDTSLKEGV